MFKQRDAGSGCHTNCSTFKCMENYDKEEMSMSWQKEETKQSK